MCREIISFVDALAPDWCDTDRMVKSGVVSSLLFDRAVDDVEGIRTKAWLPTCAIVVFSGLLPAVLLSYQTFRFRPFFGSPASL